MVSEYGDKLLAGLILTGGASNIDLGSGTYS